MTEKNKLLKKKKKKKCLKKKKKKTRGIFGERERNVQTFRWIEQRIPQNLKI